MTTRRGLFWPLLLITIGLLFLLANFGYIPGVSVLSLLNLWPLLLILAGVDIAIGRRWPLAALAIDVGVIALGLVLVATQPTMFGGPFFAFGGDEPRESDIAVQARGNTTELSLNINGGAGRYQVSGGSASLVEAHSDNADLRLREADFDRDGQRADVRIDQGVGRGGIHVGGRQARVITRVSSAVATSLEFNAGAGEFIIDLRDVNVASAEFNVGAASLTLTLPRPSTTVSITVNAGASSVIIEVPDGVEALITTKGALLSTRSTNPRVTVNGSNAETSGYATATARVAVRVTAGASSVTIR